MWLSTPFYKPESISTKHSQHILSKGNNLYGMVQDGTMACKPTFLLADAQARGCDTMFTPAALFATGLPRDCSSPPTNP